MRLTFENTDSVKGLTANDRSTEDLNALAQRYPSLVQYSGTSATPMGKIVSGHNNSSIQNFFNRGLENSTQLLFQKSGTPRGIGIQDLAEKISPYYRKYKNTELLNLSPNDWANLETRYNQIYAEQGESAAIEDLSNVIQDIVADNQSHLDKMGDALMQFSTTFAGNMVSFAGVVGGILGLGALGVLGHEDVEGAGGFTNYIDSIVNNSLTRFGKRMIDNQAFTEEGQREAEEIGLPQYNLARRHDEAAPTSEESEAEALESSNPALSLLNWGKRLVNGTFNENTVYDLFAQQGFTASSILQAWATAGIGKLITTGVKAIPAMQTAARMANYAKVTNKISPVISAGIVGSSEGAVEGLQARDRVMEEGFQALNEAHAAKAEERFKELSADPSNAGMSQEALYAQAWQEYAPEFDEAAKQIELDAAKAGATTFGINSAINGILNATFHAAMQAPSVKRAFANNKLTSWAQKKPKVGKSLTKWEKAWEIAKEPLGEFGEEFTQNIAQEASTAEGLANVNAFIDNKYNGDGTAALGDTFVESSSAFWESAAKELTSVEGWKSGIYGALSSVMGTPFPGARRNAQGKWGRGKNADGSNESLWQMTRRLSPWRSGLTASINAIEEEERASKDYAERVKSWMEDPSNRSKFDGAAGTISWATDMEEKGTQGDEFGFRNSVLGKTINDVLFLEEYQGSELYNEIMENLETAAQSEDEETAKAAKKILNLREKVLQKNSEVEDIFGVVDEDTKQSIIFNELAKEDWTERKGQLDSELAEVQSKILQQSSATESQKAESEETPTPPAKASEVLNDEEAAVLISYGDKSGLIRHQQTIEEQKKKAEEQLALLEEKDAINNEKVLDALYGEKRNKENVPSKSKRKADLLKKKRALKRKTTAINDRLKILDKLLSMDKLPVFTAEEIMNMSPKKRAAILKNGALKRWNQLHNTPAKQAEKRQEEKREAAENPTQEPAQETAPVETQDESFYSAEQTKIINDILDTGIAEDAKFFDKIVDRGKIEDAIENWDRTKLGLLMDNKVFSRYALNRKMEAKGILAKKRAEKLSDENMSYKDFSAELNSILTESDPIEQSVILSTLAQSNNENYKKFEQARQYQTELLQTALNREGTTQNDLNLLRHTVNYLSENNVDMSDSDAVLSALTESNEDGTSTKFDEYLSTQNEGKNIEDEDFVVGNPEMALSLLRSIDNDLTKDKAKIAARTAPPTPIEQSSTPSAAVIPATPERSETTPKPEAAQPKTPAPKVDLDEIARTFREHGSSDEVVDTVNQLLKAVEGEEKSRELIESLAKNKYANSKFLLAALNEAVRRKEGDRKFKKLREFLRDTNKNVTLVGIFGSSATQSQATAGPPVQPDAGLIDLVDMGWIMDSGISDSPLLTEYNRLKTGKFIVEQLPRLITEGRKVAFFVDDTLTRSVKKSMGESSYNEDQLPIAVAIQDNSGSYSIVEDGKEVKYRLIGFLPSSTAKKPSNGLNHVKQLRKLANSQSTDSPVIRPITLDGKPIYTKVQKSVFTTVDSQESNPAKETRDLLDVVATDPVLSDDTRADFKSKEKKDLISYNKFIDSVKDAVKRLFIYRGDTGGTLAIEQRNPKNNNRVGQVFLNRKKVEDTKSRDGRTLQEALESKEPIETFNSLLRRSVERISNDLRSIIEERFKENDNSLENLSDEDFKTLINPEKLKDAILYGIKEGLYVTNLDKDKIEFTLENGAIICSISGNPLGEVLNLNTLRKDVKSISDLTAHCKINADKLIRSLLRTHLNIANSAGSGILNWQVDWDDVEKLNAKGTSDGQRAAITSKLTDIMLDGIFTMKGNSISNYVPSVISVTNPFRTNNYEQTRFEQTSSGLRLAQGGAVTPTGARVDPTTGVQRGSTGRTEASQEDGWDTPEVKAVLKLIDDLQRKSDSIKLSTDEKVYESIDEENPKQYIRVTKAIEADESAGEAFNEDSPWVLPSTSIGNVVDEVVRAFFDGSFELQGNKYKIRNKNNELVDIVYPNLSNDEIQALLKQLEDFKRTQEQKGIRFVARNIKAFGTVTVSTKNGETQVPVAGTLDLLGYDKQGNLYVYDIKTIHTSNRFEARSLARSKTNNKLNSRKDKWNRQTSLYQSLLSQMTGLPAERFGKRAIVPIYVSYDNPEGGVTYTKENVESTELDSNQLLENGRRIANVAPVLAPLFELEEDYEPNIKLEDLIKIHPSLANKLKDLIEEDTESSTEENKETPQEEKPVAGGAMPEAAVSLDDLDLGFSEDDGFEGIPSLGSIVDVPQTSAPAAVSTSWGDLKDEQREKLVKEGITEEYFNSLSNEERIKLIEACCGI